MLENKFDFSIFYMLGKNMELMQQLKLKDPWINLLISNNIIEYSYNNIIDTIVDQFKTQYSSLGKLKFIERFNFSKSEEYCKTILYKLPMVVFFS